MAKFKVGDKVRVRKDLKIGWVYGMWCFNSNMSTFEGKELTVEKVYDESYRVKENTWYWTDEMLEEVKENKMEKTFREVIADIKEGEVWENYSKKIKCHFDGIQIYHKDEARHTPSMFMLDRDKFTLQRKEYTFEESLAICENQNKIMESVITGHKYKIENNIVYYLNAKGHWIKYYVFHYEEIKGNWYIN